MSRIQDLLTQIMRSIPQVLPAQLRARQAEQSPPLLLDVREADEVADGIIPGGVHVPRGVLDLRIESIAPDPHTPIVLYCGSGQRSALGARALQELGYTQVESLEGGFRAWKHEGFEFEIPRQLSAEQRVRYSRHLNIPQVSLQGQLRLLEARVLLLGAGGLGSPAALYLAAAGVGTLGLVDSDIVDRSNLQRQILHTDARVGEPKVESARQALSALNPQLSLETFYERLTPQNASRIFALGWDVILDGGDNFPTRYLVNDTAMALGIPVVHGSVYRFEGQVTTLTGSPCYRCLYPEAPPAALAPSCEEAGVLGVVPGIIGMLQATEVLKLILGIGEPLTGRLLMVDALGARFRELRFAADPACPVCG